MGHASDPRQRDPRSIRQNRISLPDQAAETNRYWNALRNGPLLPLSEIDVPAAPHCELGARLLAVVGPGVVAQPEAVDDDDDREPDSRSPSSSSSSTTRSAILHYSGRWLAG